VVISPNFSDSYIRLKDLGEGAQGEVGLFKDI
jgi:hypothetical protein